MTSRFLPADILLPRDADLRRWACVACDQYTSQPEYWAEQEAFVGSAPSALRLVLPELYLSLPDVSAREQEVLDTMEAYLSGGVFRTVENSFIYVERTQRNGCLRRGLVGMVDLESYDYAPGSRPPVRATEGTVLSRIPPRLRIRSRAALELPHVLLLADDPEDGVLSAAEAAAGEVLYDLDLPGGGGHLRGRRIPAAQAASVTAALDALGDPDAFARRYGASPEELLHLAVGDGNHSLATAKANYARLKEELGDAALAHPARYALCEVENLHDPALVFEPIHRVVFDTDGDGLIRELCHRTGALPGAGEGQNFSVVRHGTACGYHFPAPREPLCVGTLQTALDELLPLCGGRIDYVHGEDVVRSLTEQSEAVGFLLPVMGKEELFPAVIRGGALPRKTFSMGEAHDKRFYMEARRISRSDPQ